MSEYIITCDEETASWVGNDVEAMRPLVRCRDCVEYEPYHTFAGMKLDYGECMQHRRQTNDERFCWWGERSDR